MVACRRVGSNCLMYCMSETIRRRGWFCWELTHWKKIEETLIDCLDICSGRRSHDFGSFQAYVLIDSRVQVPECLVPDPQDAQAFVPYSAKVILIQQVLHVKCHKKA
ncbi:hypothetical protein AAHA92_14402 [Salvia divinorum]|uniref:Uncharacterized protein n=1 Tax=Salvia divinorum TaxID=28513 RepID=A0ABD1HC72_SALDI